MQLLQPLTYRIESEGKAWRSLKENLVAVSSVSIDASFALDLVEETGVQQSPHCLPEHEDSMSENTKSGRAESMDPQNGTIKVSNVSNAFLTMQKREENILVYQDRLVPQYSVATTSS